LRAGAEVRESCNVILDIGALSSEGFSFHPRHIRGKEKCVVFSNSDKCELTLGLRRGEPGAWAELCARFGGALFGFAFHLCGEESAWTEDGRPCPGASLSWWPMRPG